MTGFFHFYGIVLRCHRGWYIRCQCPMTGFFHFYRFGTGLESSLLECQCPMTGFFHFYRSSSKGSKWPPDVSMPYDGLFSFLLWRSPPVPERVRGVNALWRAFFISTYGDWSREDASRCFCVNALWRAFFISTWNRGHWHRSSIRVNALWRAFFISTSSRTWSYWNDLLVSMPYDGLFSFLRKWIKSRR